MSPHSTAETPDEVGERMPVHEWLDHTRRIDLAKAVGRGRATNPDRYGGMHPSALGIGASEGESRGADAWAHALGLKHQDHGADEAF